MKDHAFGGYLKFKKNGKKTRLQDYVKNEHFITKVISILFQCRNQYCRWTKFELVKLIKITKIDDDLDGRKVEPI